jgi:hypothetical protein
MGADVLVVAGVKLDTGAAGSSGVPCALFCAPAQRQATNSAVDAIRSFTTFAIFIDDTLHDHGVYRSIPVYQQ